MQGLSDLLKPLETAPLVVQLLVGVAVAGVFGWRMLAEFRKGVATEVPPPKPGQAVVEMASITDMQPWRDMVSETRRCADALELIAESFRVFNKREETEDARHERDRERAEREELRRLMTDLQNEVRARRNPRATRG